MGENILSYMVISQVLINDIPTASLSGPSVGVDRSLVVESGPSVAADVSWSELLSADSISCCCWLSTGTGDGGAGSSSFGLDKNY